MNNQETSIVVNEGGRSSLLSAVTTSQQSAVMNADYVYVFATAACFVRQGSNPTAVTDGTDIYIPANTPLRLNITRGNKLAFAASSSANIYLTPGG